MKAGVEAGHLRHARQPRRDGLDRREVVGLVQRRQRNQLAQLLDHLRRHDRRAGESPAAVHDAVTDADDPRAGVSRRQPGREHVEGRVAVAHVVAERLGRRATAFRVRHGETRAGADAVDLAADFDAPAPIPDCRKTQNFRLDEPALMTRANGSISDPYAVTGWPVAASGARPAPRRRSWRSARGRCRHGW